jgi:excisionase family DNA binding protein
MDSTNIETDKPKEVIRVSISEAAKLFGVNSQTIRRAIASKEIVYIVVAGRYKLNFESLVKWSQRHTTIKNKLENKGIGQFIGNWKIKNPLYSPAYRKTSPPPENQPVHLEKKDLTHNDTPYKTDIKPS